MKYTVLAACLIIPCSALGEIYKWVDEDGQTHFGQHPAGRGAEEIVIPEKDISPGALTDDDNQRRENIKKWVDARQQEREKMQQQKAELKKESDARKRKCAELMRELRDMEEGGISWYRLDDEGNRQFFSDAEIEVAKQERRAVLDRNCR